MCSMCTPSESRELQQEAPTTMMLSREGTYGRNNNRDYSGGIEPLDLRNLTSAGEARVACNAYHVLIFYAGMWLVLVVSRLPKFGEWRRVLAEPCGSRLMSNPWYQPANESFVDCSHGNTGLTTRCHFCYNVTLYTPIHSEVSVLSSRLAICLLTECVEMGTHLERYQHAIVSCRYAKVWELALIWEHNSCVTSYPPRFSRLSSSPLP